MVLKTAVLHNQRTEFQDHLDRHDYKYQAGKSTIDDLCRIRTEPLKETRLVTYHQLLFDGVPQTGELSQFLQRNAKETIDVSCGKDNEGNWIGGPFASHSYESKRNPTSRWDQDKVENPQFLRPPHYFWTSTSYMPPFLSPPPTKLLRFYNPAFGVHPSALDVAINQAVGKLQGARNNTRPDSTYADFAQSIVELREVSQLVNLRSKRMASLIGSAILSVEFGWRPIISDVKKIMNLTSSLKKRISFLKKNAGKPIRRKRTLFKITEHHGEISKMTAGPAYPQNTVLPVEGEYSVVGWSEHEATYHSVLRYNFHDDPKSTGWNDSAARHLMGLQLDLTLLWELAPYTWLVDWVTNIGDLVEGRWRNQLVDSAIHEEWITITSKFHQFISIPTVAGKYPNEESHSNASSERTDTFKYRMIPPAVAPFELVNLISFNQRQQAILASLLAIKLQR